MSKKILKISCLCLASVMAGAADYTCPREIQTDQHVLRKPAGWEPFIDTTYERHQMSNVGFYDGPPKEKASLVPDNESTTEPPIWTFGPPQKGRKIWQVCSYTQTAVALTRPLPDTIKSCRWEYDKPEKGMINGHPEIKSIICE